MDVLIHGNEKEKLKQSFALLDIRARSKVTYPDFLEVAVNVTRMWSAAYGKPGKQLNIIAIVELDENVIEKVFNTISNNKKYFKSKDYINVVRKHPDLMTWLTKPKELLDEKLEKNVSAKENQYSSEMINEMISDTKQFIDEVIQTIDKVLKVFKASRDDFRRRSRSFSIKTGKNPFKKEQSIKLQDIVKKEFLIKQETIKTATKAHQNQFLPGVERKKLKKKTTGANDSIELSKFIIYLL